MYEAIRASLFNFVSLINVPFGTCLSDDWLADSNTRQIRYPRKTISESRTKLSGKCWIGDEILLHTTKVVSNAPSGIPILSIILNGLAQVLYGKAQCTLFRAAKNQIIRNNAFAFVVVNCKAELVVSCPLFNIESIIQSNR